MNMLWSSIGFAWIAANLAGVIIAIIWLVRAGRVWQSTKTGNPVRNPPLSQSQATALGVQVGSALLLALGIIGPLVYSQTNSLVAGTAYNGLQYILPVMAMSLTLVAALVLSDLVVSRRRISGPHRSADLSPRASQQLIPPWLRIAPWAWIALALSLGTLTSIVGAPDGHTLYSLEYYAESSIPVWNAVSPWPGWYYSVLIALGCLVTGAIYLAGLHYLTHRPALSKLSADQDLAARAATARWLTRLTQLFLAIYPLGILASVSSALIRIQSSQRHAWHASTNMPVVRVEPAWIDNPWFTLAPVILGAGVLLFALVGSLTPATAPVFANREITPARPASPPNSAQATTAHV